MIEYVCSIVDMADNRKQKHQEQDQQYNASKEKDGVEPLAESPAKKDDNEVSKKPNEKHTESSALMTSIAISLQSIQVCCAKKLINDIEVTIEDPTAHCSIEKLIATLTEVYSEDEDSSDGKSNDTLIETMKKATLCDSHQSGDGKHNELPCFDDEAG
eukprot:10197082-Ditylum_brightwellii.AAC.1